MSFDLSWFTSAGGLLITGGVILLTIALIILIVTGKKPKKDKNVGAVPTENQVQATNTPVGMNPNMLQQNNVQPVISGTDSFAMNGGVVTDASVSSVPSSPVENVTMPMTEPVSTVDSLANPQMPVSPMVGDVASSSPVEAVTMPMTEPVSTVDPLANPQMPVSPMGGDVVSPSPVETTSIPMVEAMPASDNSAVSTEPVSFEAPQIPVVNPTAPSIEENNVVGPDIPAAPLVESTMPSPIVPEINTQPTMQIVDTHVSTSEPVIYGGASPIVSDINFNQNTDHQIYGGADPLQNTQTIPTVNPGVVAVEPQNTEVLGQPELVPVAPIEVPSFTNNSGPVMSVAPAVPAAPAAPAVPVPPVAPAAPVVSTNQAVSQT